VRQQHKGSKGTDNPYRSDLRNLALDLEAEAVEIKIVEVVVERILTVWIGQ
jgi:hypothetical protein